MDKVQVWVCPRCQTEVRGDSLAFLLEQITHHVNHCPTDEG